MLKVAIIGAGVMGALHARIITELPDVKLIAICDTDKSKSKMLAKLYKAKFYSDYHKLLKDTALDGVIIAVPTSLHKEVAVNCILRKINVLIEKPLAQSEKDAKSIIDIAKEKNVILTVGHIERFNPAVIKLKELIKKDVIGEIVSIVIKRVGLYPPRIKDVNVVTDLAVHDLDIVCYLLDKFPVTIFATGGKGANKTQVDYADILLDFGGTSCYLQVNWITPIKIRTLAITGILGYAELDYITQDLYLYKSNSPLPLPEKFKDFILNFGRSKKNALKIKKEEPLKLEIMNFINAISKKETLRVTGEQGLLVVKLAETVLTSLIKKRPMQLNKDY